MKKLLYILIFLSVGIVFSQDKDQRIQNIKNQLEALSVESSGLNDIVKNETSVSNITLSNFLLAIAQLNKLNINVAPELNQITLANNFPDVKASDLLVFLCKEYDLVIDFTGNILSFKKYQKPIKNPDDKVIPVTYEPSSNIISIDAKGDKLYDVFKRIMDESGKNLVFTPGLENKFITAYIQNTDFDSAMDKLALANSLYLEKTKDGFYVFEDDTQTVSANNTNLQQTIQRPNRRRSSNFFFEVKDAKNNIVSVDFVNTPIADIINDIANELKLDVFTATPLDQAGSATFKARKISFDNLLVKLFEAQAISSSTISSPTTNRNGQSNTITSTNSSSVFSFKKDGNIYFFGTENQLSIRKVEAIKLQHRSVSLLNDPSGSNTFNPNSNYNTSSNNKNFNNSGNQFDNVNRSANNRDQLNTRGNTGNFNSYDTQAEALVNILPDEIKKDLDIKVDYELNSFYVNGPSAKVERFKKFLKEIDKPVPVVLIEVMIIEVNKSATIDAGVDWGIGDSPTTTQGAIFPEANIALGATTINRIIGSFNDFAGFNLGKVGPNFFANIRALETNGDLKVKSTPRLATLNSHRAVFSNSQTSFYAVTQRNIYGTDNPQTSEITNYYPIDAELSLIIKPSVTGNGKVILDIGVIQSSFGSRIAEDAPPDINARSFSSIISMQDQDIAILGGIEEQFKSNSGSGVPFLAKIPVIKWLFSKRVREARKSKLTVLIKPTIIN